MEKNIYRILGDYVHLVSFFFLLSWIWIHRTSAGVSGKSQVALALTFTARYLDLFVLSISVYNSSMKALYLFFSYAIVVSIYWVFRNTYQKQLDTFRVECLIVAALTLAVVINYQETFYEISWTFSIYLEAVAMWPQFCMIYKSKRVTTMVFFYLLANGVYRFLYIGNWIYRYYYENHWDFISFVSGSVQVVPFVIFWLLCLTKVVPIVHNYSDWFTQNLTGSEGVFIIDLPDGKEKGWDETSDLRYLKDPINEKEKKGVVEPVHVIGRG